MEDQGSLSLLSEPGAIRIEAAEGGPENRPGLPRFSMVAYTGGAMRIEGWRYPVIVDLAGMAIPTQNRPIRFGHDAASGVGHTDQIRMDGGQLMATGVVSRDTAAAKEIVVSARNGFPWQASIGASVEEFEFVKENQRVLVNGREFSGPVNVVRKSTLGEISFVDLGADGQTSATVAAQRLSASSQEESHPMETTVVNPQSESAPNESQPAPAPVQAGASTPAAEPTGPTAAQIRAAAYAEKKRLAAIEKIFAGRFPEVEARAIEEGWDVPRTETEFQLASLRDGRPKAPAIHAKEADIALSGRMLEAACLQAAKLDGVEKLFDDKTLEAADGRYHGRIGLQELLIEVAWAKGYRGRTFHQDPRSALRFAFRPEIEAEGFSTIDIGGILSNVANKFLLDGFFSVERAWRNICAVRNVSDFKTVTSYRLIGADQYEQVSPGGELKHGTLGNESYSNKADTYGLMLSIDRRDIINDDLGAITTVPRKFRPPDIAACFPGILRDWGGGVRRRGRVVFWELERGWRRLLWYEHAPLPGLAVARGRTGFGRANLSQCFRVVR